MFSPHNEAKKGKKNATGQIRTGVNSPNCDAIFSKSKPSLDFLPLANENNALSSEISHI